MPSTVSADLSPAPFGRVLTAMVTPFDADGALDLDAAASASPPTWSTRATTGSWSAGRPVSRRRRPTPRRSRCCGRSSRPSATAPRSSPASAPTTPRTPSRRPGRPRRPARTGCSSSPRTTASHRRPGCSRTSRAVADATELPVMLYDIPGRTGVADRDRDAGPRWPSTRGSSRSRTPRATCTTAPGSWPAPTWPTTPATTRSNLAWLAHGAVGVVSVVGARRRPAATRRWWRRCSSGDLRTAQRDLPRAAARRARHHDPHPGSDHGQGRAAAARRARHASRPAAAGRGDRGRAVSPCCGPTWREAALLEATRVSHPHPELTAPPPLAAGALRIVALGGLGEVGRNMAVLEYDGKLLIIDCGVLFPEDHQPGVDLILPDFDYISRPARRHRGGRADPRPRGPHRRRPVPAARARGHPAGRLAAHARADRGQAQGAPDHAAHAGRARGPGRAARAVRAASSSRSTTRSPTRWPSPSRTAGRHGAAHRRLQDGPAAAGRPDHRPAAPSRGWARRASTCSWSTRPTPRCPGFTTSEREIGPVLDTRLRRGGAPDHRGVASPPTCTACSRCSTPRRGTAARSRSSAARWCATWASPATSATSTCPTACVVDVKEVDDLPDDKVVLMCTGSQGEPMAALSRMASSDHRDPDRRGRHRDPRLVAHPRQRERGLPRHQRADPARARRSCTRATRACTSSGHASAGELLYCYNIVRPRNVMPVHGEIRHLRANAELAVADGRAARAGRARRGRRGRRPGRTAGARGRRRPVRLRLRRRLVASATSPTPTLKDRRILGEEGFISIFVVVDSATGKVAGRPGDPRPRLRRGRRASSTRCCRRIEAAARRGRRAGVDRRLPAAAGRPPGRRPWVGDKLPPPPDDHPGGRRGLTVARHDRDHRRWSRSRRCVALAATDRGVRRTDARAHGRGV